jgi:iron complex outermembrane receptor protein
MYQRYLLLLTASAALSLQAGADPLTEEDFFGEIPVVLSASRLSQPLSRAPAAVTVIDQDMIRASGFRDVPDLFRLVPGFNVAYTRDNTWGVGYHGLADAFSRRMQVLIDGRSVYTPGFGEVPWASLPLSIEDIQRIEVVRGPNAAAYGANAFFGVINIITKDPLEVQGGRSSLQVGEQGMRGALFRYGGGGGSDFRYRLSLSDQRRDRFDTQAEKTTTRHLDFRSDYRISNSDELTVNLALSRGDWRQGRDREDDPLRSVDTGSEHFQARFRRVIDPATEWTLQFYHFRLHKDDDFVFDETSIPLGPIAADLGYTQWREDIEFQMITSPARQLRLAWGAEARWEGAESNGYFYQMDDRTGSMYRLFGNLEWLLSEQWVINTGLMAEHHYYTGLDFSPRLAINYMISNDHALRASISQGYRSPTFFEVEGDARLVSPTGFDWGQIFAPAGNLRPEKILSREIGYVGHFKPLDLRVDARLFDDRVSNLIGSDDSTGPYIFSNSSFADIRGADIQARWQPDPRIDLILSYARVNIDSNDNDISNSAPWNNFSALGIFRLPKGWEASASVYRVGYMEWLDDGDPTQAYTRIDARIARHWKWRGHKLDFSLVGQNLGGDRHTEFRVQNEFDRRAYISLGFDW